MKDLHLLLINTFNQITDKKPYLINFLKLVYDEIIEFLSKNNSIDKLPLLFSQLSVKYSKSSIEKKIQEMHPNSEIVILEKDNITGVKKGLVNVNFKDNNDEQIFQELMTNIFELKPIELFSDDKEFKEKCTIGYAEIEKIFALESGAFSFVLM